MRSFGYSEEDRVEVCRGTYMLALDIQAAKEQRKNDGPANTVD
jgi:hypothetical protein